MAAEGEARCGRTRPVKDVECAFGDAPGAEIESAVDGLDSALSKLLELTATKEPWEQDRIRAIRDCVRSAIHAWGLPLPNACIPGDASFPLRLLLEAEDSAEPRLTQLGMACQVTTKSGDAKWDAEEAWDRAVAEKDRALGEILVHLGGT